MLSAFILANFTDTHDTERLTNLGKLNLVFKLEPIFTTALQATLKMTLNSKVVKIDCKIIISLC